MEEEPCELIDHEEIEMPSIGEINAIYLAEQDEKRTIEILQGMGM